MYNSGGRVGGHSKCKMSEETNNSENKSNITDPPPPEDNPSGKSKVKHEEGIAGEHEEGITGEPCKSKARNRDKRMGLWRKPLQERDFTTDRFECFCNRQYLSYATIYQHLGKQHPDFFMKHRSHLSKHFISTVNPTYGYKIRKVVIEEVGFSSRTKNLAVVPQANFRGRQKDYRTLSEKLEASLDAMQVKYGRNIMAKEYVERMLGLQEEKASKQQKIIELK